MLNYAEELAYWYLRLNGFFLIENFVIHKEEELLEYRADADLLGVRFPAVREKIGDSFVDFDTENLFGLFNPQKTIAVIVEVKSSKEGDIEPEIFLNPGRMAKALDRLGLELSDEEKQMLVRRTDWITSGSVIGEKPFQIGKLFIHNIRGMDQIGCAGALSLAQLRNFIIGRFVRYKEEKWPSRMFFPSSLMQYLIWETGN